MQKKSNSQIIEKATFKENQQKHRRNVDTLLEGDSQSNQTPTGFYTFLQTVSHNKIPCDYLICIEDT